MGIITSIASPGQASVPEDAAQLQLKKTSSEDKTKYEFYRYITPELICLTDWDDDNLTNCSSESVGGILMLLTQFLSRINPYCSLQM